MFKYYPEFDKEISEKFEILAQDVHTICSDTKMTVYINCRSNIFDIYDFVLDNYQRFSDVRNVAVKVSDEIARELLKEFKSLSLEDKCRLEHIYNKMGLDFVKIRELISEGFKHEKTA